MIQPLESPPDLWITARELCDSTPEDPDYITDEVMILGAITELTAGIKAGKTTFMGRAMKAIFSGEKIIGLSTRVSNILYLTEEGPSTFRAMLMRSGLEKEDRLHVLHRGKVWRMEWKDVVLNVVLPKLEETGSKYVVIDTIARWANVKGDEENQTGAAQQAMEPLELLRDKGYGVMVVRHARKAGGGIGENSRGGSAWGGAVDVLLSLTNPGTFGHQNRRVLESLGRFHDPRKWTMDLEEDGYHLVNEDGGMESQNLRNKLLEFQGSDMKLTINDVVKTFAVSKTTAYNAVNQLAEEGLITITGGGRKGSPRLICFGPENDSSL